MSRRMPTGKKKSSPTSFSSPSMSYDPCRLDARRKGTIGKLALVPKAYPPGRESPKTYHRELGQGSQQIVTNIDADDHDWIMESPPSANSPPLRPSSIERTQALGFLMHDPVPLVIPASPEPSEFAEKLASPSIMDVCTSLPVARDVARPHACEFSREDFDGNGGRSLLHSGSSETYPTSFESFFPALPACSPHSRSAFASSVFSSSLPCFNSTSCPPTTSHMPQFYASNSAPAFVQSSPLLGGVSDFSGMRHFSSPSPAHQSSYPVSYIPPPSSRTSSTVSPGFQWLSSVRTSASPPVAPLLARFPSSRSTTPSFSTSPSKSSFRTPLSASFPPIISTSPSCGEPTSSRVAPEQKESVSPIYCSPSLLPLSFTPPEIYEQCESSASSSSSLSALASSTSKTEVIFISTLCQFPSTASDSASAAVDLASSTSTAPLSPLLLPDVPRIEPSSCMSSLTTIPSPLNAFVSSTVTGSSLPVPASKALLSSSNSSSMFDEYNGDSLPPLKEAPFQDSKGVDAVVRKTIRGVTGTRVVERAIHISEDNVTSVKTVRGKKAQSLKPTKKDAEITGFFAPISRAKPTTPVSAASASESAASPSSSAFSSSPRACSSCLRSPPVAIVTNSSSSPALVCSGASTIVLSQPTSTEKNASSRSFLSPSIENLSISPLSPLVARVLEHELDSAPEDPLPTPAMVVTSPVVPVPPPVPLPPPIPARKNKFRRSSAPAALDTTEMHIQSSPKFPPLPSLIVPPTKTFKSPSGSAKLPSPFERSLRAREWTCSRCTLSNSMKQQICGACEAPRPGAEEPPLKTPPGNKTKRQSQSSLALGNSLGTRSGKKGNSPNTSLPVNNTHLEDEDNFVPSICHVQKQSSPHPDGLSRSQTDYRQEQLVGGDSAGDVGSEEEGEYKFTRLSELKARGMLAMDHDNMFKQKNNRKAPRKTKATTSVENLSGHWRYIGGKATFFVSDGRQLTGKKAYELAQKVHQPEAKLRSHIRAEKAQAKEAAGGTKRRKTLG